RVEEISFAGSLDVEVEIGRSARATPGRDLAAPGAGGRRIKFSVVESQQKAHLVVDNGLQVGDKRRTQFLCLREEGETDWRRP
ncbi:MAG TPA: hypothetical protein VM492_09005, partial [Sumerlaeia bacterium]|nr:hypothetical protein [Sumerlaeia bacterium]